jgi:hypothetical protein
MEFLGLSDVFSDLLITIIKITINFTIFIFKTILRGFSRVLFDTLRYFEVFIDHLEHLFKR